MQKAGISTWGKGLREVFKSARAATGTCHMAEGTAIILVSTMEFLWLAEGGGAGIPPSS